MSHGTELRSFKYHGTELRSFKTHSTELHSVMSNSTELHSFKSHGTEQRSFKSHCTELWNIISHDIELLLFNNAILKSLAMTIISKSINNAVNQWSLNKWVWSNGGMILTLESRCKQRKEMSRCRFVHYLMQETFASDNYLQRIPVCNAASDAEHTASHKSVVVL